VAPGGAGQPVADVHPISPVSPAGARLLTHRRGAPRMAVPSLTAIETAAGSMVVEC